MTYKQSLEATKKVLDSLDILSYMRKGEALSALMDRLDDACTEMPILQEEPFEGFLFNWMDESEFSNYLLRRYGKSISFQDVSTIYYFCHK